MCFLLYVRKLLILRYGIVTYKTADNRKTVQDKKNKYVYKFMNYFVSDAEIIYIFAVVYTNFLDISNLPFKLLINKRSVFEHIAKIIIICVSSDF